MGLSDRVQVLAEPWNNIQYETRVKGLENEPEGGKRCEQCFRLRLKECALVAKRCKFDYFCSTLTVSRFKNTALINSVGEAISDEIGVKWLPSDFKKKGGQQRSNELAEQYQLYRQVYCGCEYSLQQRKTYIINNLRDKHIYLSVKPAQNENECSYGNLKDKNNNTCSRELSYLLYYYTTSSHRQYADNNIYKLDYSLDSRANFYLHVPQINNVDEKYLEYDLIWTKDEKYAKYLESICFLSQIFNNEIEVDNTTVFIEKNIKLNRRNKILLRKIYLSSKPVYINLLVRNTKNNELISFEPIEAHFSKSSIRIVVVLAILIFIFVPICFYYDTIKEKCGECNNNGFSFSSLFGKKEENIKYSNLSDNYF